MGLFLVLRALMLLLLVAQAYKPITVVYISEKLLATPLTG
jgi:hypothetical protein